MIEVKGLPANIEAERFVLGSVFLDNALFIQVAAALSADDFSLEKHRRIFSRMAALNKRSEEIDYVTVAHELNKHSQLEACDGLAYLTSLADGLPRLENIAGYIRIVKQCSARRSLIFASQEMMNRALADTVDLATIVGDAERKLLQIGGVETAAKGGLRTPKYALDNFDGGINAFLDPSKRAKGLLTGYAKLDELTAGLHPGDLFILAARPSMGKTTFALNVAQNVALQQHKPVAIFSLEMSTDSLLNRMLCAAARVDSWRFKMGYANTPEERRRLSAALAEIYEAPLYIDDTSDVEPMGMHAKLRSMPEKPALVIVDYLQLMTLKGKENRNQEISTISRSMKLIAKELQAPVMALSQLSRDVEKRTGDHRPQMADLRESGSIEQDADVVGFIFREEVYKKDREDLKGLAELIIAKQRNGPIGTANLVFLANQTRFENRSED